MSKRAPIIINLAFPFLLYGLLLFLPLRTSSLWSETPPQESLPDAPSHVSRLRPPAQTSPDTHHSRRQVDGGWPRAADRENEQILMYEPQLESWDGDLVRAYAAVSEIKKDAKTAKYGVVRFMAHTEVDKVNRQVTLEDFQITKVEFPTMREREAEYRDFLQAKLPGKSRIIALDRMEAALQATHAAKSGIEGLAVNNDPPQIIFATKPAVLVLIDGPPKLEAIESTRLQQVLNTKSTIILDTEKPKYYLNVMDGWVESSELTGPWSYTAEIPKQMPEIIKGIKERQLADTPEGEVPASPKKASEEEKVPAV